MECSVQREPGSVSFGFDCHTGLPCLKTIARSSAEAESLAPFTRATAASNSWKLFVSAASSPCVSSQAFASCAVACVLNAMAATASASFQCMVPP